MKPRHFLCRSLLPLGHDVNGSKFHRHDEPPDGVPRHGACAAPVRVPKGPTAQRLHIFGKAPSRDKFMPNDRHSERVIGTDYRFQ